MASTVLALYNMPWYRILTDPVWWIYWLSSMRREQTDSEVAGIQVGLALSPGFTHRQHSLSLGRCCCPVDGSVASGPKDGSIQGLEVEMKTTNPQDAECLKTMSLPSVFSSQGGS